MFVLLFLYLAPQGAVGQPQAQGLPYPRLIGAAEHRAVRLLSQCVAAAQDLQWAEGIQRRGQRAEAPPSAAAEAQRRKTDGSIKRTPRPS